MFHRTSRPVLEQLEPRIAPASVLTFTDMDGDIVKLRSSKGVLTGHATFQSNPDGPGEQLQVLDLTDDTFANANIRFTVQRGPNGDGSVNVGFINAADNDLGNVRLPGDLGRIVAGDSNAGTPAVKLLKVRSMGLLGDSTQGGVVTGTTLLPLAVQDLLDQLVGTAGAASGLLGEIADGVNNILNDDSALQTLPSDVVRILSSLQANLAALDTANVGQLGDLSGTPQITSLLGNIGQEITRLGLLPNTTEVLGPLLPNLLQAVGTDLGEVLGVMHVPVLNIVDLGGLLDRPLDQLVTIPALGGLLGGGGPGSGSPTTVGALLTDLSGTISNLLNLDGTAPLPIEITTLLHQVGDDLSGLLAGSSGLTSGDLTSLADLQTNLAGLLGLANTLTGILDPVTKTAIDAVNTTLETVLGGSGLLGGSTHTQLSSVLHGDLRSLRVQSDVKDVFLNIQGNLGSAIISGGLVGDQAINGGQLLVTGNLGSLLVKRNVVGGEFANSGSITVNGKTGLLRVNGSLVGDDGASTGKLTFHGDVQSLFIKGDLAGNEGNASGAVMNDNGDLRHVFIRGSIVSGNGQDSGTLRTSDAIKTLTVIGSVVGDADNRASIVAGGVESKVGHLDKAIGTLTVNGSVRFAEILSGYDNRMGAVNGDAQIGTVLVNKTWQASNLSAGVAPMSGSRLDFGESNNHAISSSNSADITASINRIVIRGNVFGTPGGTDSYGFVAEQIRIFNLNHARMPLSAGSSNDVLTLSESTGGDVFIREVTTTQPAQPIL